MAKKAAYFEEAERLYVYEQMTLEGITGKIPVSVRTLSGWKNDGDWDGKRRQYLESRQSFHEELYQLARKLARSVSVEIDAGEKPDAGRLYALLRLSEKLLKVKEYEDVAAKEEATRQPARGITEDVLRLIEEEVLGIRRKPAEEKP